jgi:hypothetical protein
MLPYLGFDSSLLRDKSGIPKLYVRHRCYPAQSTASAINLCFRVITAGLIPRVENHLKARTAFNLLFKRLAVILANSDWVANRAVTGPAYVLLHLSDN